jgi:hypothetical protein
MIQRDLAPWLAQIATLHATPSGDWWGEARVLSWLGFYAKKFMQDLRRFLESRAARPGAERFGVRALLSAALSRRAWNADLACSNMRASGDSPGGGDGIAVSDGSQS